MSQKAKEHVASDDFRIFPSTPSPKWPTMYPRVGCSAQNLSLWLDCCQGTASYVRCTSLRLLYLIPSISNTCSQWWDYYGIRDPKDLATLDSDV